MTLYIKKDFSDLASFSRCLKTILEDAIVAILSFLALKRQGFVE
jgi:hypothetical protein